MPSGFSIRPLPRVCKLAICFALSLCVTACGGPAIDLPVPVARAPHIDIPAENVLRFAGDVMLTRGVGRRIREAHDPSLPFRQIAPFLAGADIAFVNLESPFSDKGKRTQSGLIFNADPVNVAGLQLAGIDVVSTANNHSRDARDYGVAFTYRWLLAHGIQPVGSALSPIEAHRGVVIERHGVRFGFLAYTYDQQNGNWHDIDQRIVVIGIPAMRRDVSELARKSDVVIVSMHNGIEYREHPNQSQIGFARAAIDAGAKLVIGHHPHVVQPFEWYRQGLIFYSLGNFVFDQFQRQATQRGEIAEVRFLGGFIASAQLFPVQVTQDGPVLVPNAPKEKAPGTFRRASIDSTIPAGDSKGESTLPQTGDDQKPAPQQ
jgi:poly-gamma-glutamate capsule biosynthesis protein CapA/YwtB (metallophosphatase superfamily)